MSPSDYAIGEFGARKAFRKPTFVFQTGNGWEIIVMTKPEDVAKWQPADGRAR
jgi:hypothetical protein